ncbi:MAG: TetR/AcrR family transcriptional regulator [Epsilonproteobacteria bacterium]|nr:TetR/AcrR family transcriptional regulator [Campylobacterota bacterium]
MARIIDKEEKRLEIARAAIPLFAAKNISQISIDEIAKNAGVAKGTIYLYFKNKEEIIFTIWDMLSRNHEEAYAKRAMHATSAKAKILEYFNFNECGLEYDKEQMITLYQHSLSAMLIDTTGLYTAYFDRFIRQDYDLISACLQEGIQSGEFEIDDVELLTYTIIMLLKGMLVRAKAGNMHFDEAQQTLSKHISNLLQQYIRKSR